MLEFSEFFVSFHFSLVISIDEDFDSCEESNLERMAFSDLWRCRFGVQCVLQELLFILDFSLPRNVKTSFPV